MTELPCTAYPKENCKDCQLNGPLMCRYEERDTIHFFMLILPLFVTAIGGFISVGLGWWLAGWVVFMLIFFEGWEARVLCSHCPYWAEPGKVLKCHANYGVIKLWRYRPEPMNRWEKGLFILGLVVFGGYPIVMFLVAGAYLLTAISTASVASAGYLLWHNICDRCVNFSCPLNHAPENFRQAFYARNPNIAEAVKKAVEG